MAKRRSKQQDSRSLIATILSAIVVGLAALFGLIGGGAVDPEPGAPAATTAPSATTAPGVTQVASGGGAASVSAIQLGQYGLGARRSFWEVYFTTPTGSRDLSTYRNGVDYPLAAAIDGVQRTLDIAAYEWNSPRLTEAVLGALRRNVRVRMVVDDEGTIEDDDTTIGQLIDAGAQVVDDSRSALMHNKFMILDSQVVWTGSTNFTINDVYRNNNNLIMLRSRRAVEAYQAEFDEMFGGQFGPRSSDSNSVNFAQDGVPIQIYFAPENQVLQRIVPVVQRAQTSIRFMTFSFTEATIAEAILARSEAGVSVQGIFETRGSETEFSELRPLFCAGLDVRQDGNPNTFHHKVIIVDNRIVITGSFNWSQNATTANDENLVIIEDPALAAQFSAEFDRVWQRATVPARSLCS
ncbi:MAG: phospholipase D-like domain-containing protein [bacterium]|nr:phospholipase D-like domain-containing protein [bacterium]